MSETEWLRSFLAAYRAESLTDAAALRGISQPAVSQHLAALEQAMGARLFLRRPGGVEPTSEGRELYALVTEPLDALEVVLRRLRGTEMAADAPVRFGSSPELFAAEVVPLLAGTAVALAATFGGDAELLDCLERGELDLVVTSTPGPRRAARCVPAGVKRFALVAAPALAPRPPLGSIEALSSWLLAKDWASYSLELPITRRFFAQVLGRPFPGRPRLVAPDLRAVLRAVELGVGVSLLPTFVCADALDGGRIVEPYAVGDLVPEEPWFACTRAGAPSRPAVTALLDALVRR